MTLTRLCIASRALSAVVLALLLSACAAGAPLPTPTAPPQPTPTAAPVPTATPVPEPSPTVPAAISTTVGVTYSLPVAAGGNSFALDVYAPTGRSGLPVVVFLHGLGENRRGYERMSRELAQAGNLVFTADWPAFAFARGAEQRGRGYREALETAACAVRTARAVASARGADVGRVTLAGFSAGGGIAATLALQGDQPEALWNDFAAQGGPERQVRCVQTGDSAQVAALVGIAGAYGLGEFARDRDPALAAVLLPPQWPEARKRLRVRLLHGKADSLVPVDVSLRFESVLSSAGFDVKLNLHDGPHAVPVALFVETVRQLWAK